MTGLPRGWVWAHVPEVADVLDSMRVPVNRDERARRPGNVPYYGATGQVGWIDQPLFTEELCLLGEDGAPFLNRAKPKAYVIDGPAWVNNHAHILRATSATTTRYLKYVLDWIDYRPFVNGTTRLKLTKRALSEMPIPLPPGQEQRRIVAAIEEQFSRLDAATVSVKRVRAALAGIGRSVRSPAVSTGAEYAVGDLLEGIEAGRSFRCHSHPATGDAWGVIKVSAMTWGSFDESENKEVISQGQADPRWEIGPGDLLLSRANTTDYVGASVVVGHCRPRLLLSDKSLRLLPAPGVDRKWLHAALSSGEVRSQISTVASGTSDSMRNISQDKLRAIRVRMPELEEQRRIVAEVEQRLSLIDALDDATTSAQRRSAALRRSILERAFRGELVPQDPSDEPATLLLERIRAERAKERGAVQPARKKRDEAGAGDTRRRPADPGRSGGDRSW